MRSPAKAASDMDVTDCYPSFNTSTVGKLDEKIEQLEATIHRMERESVAKEIKGAYQATDEYLDGLMQTVHEAKEENDRR